ncbi:MAG: penicillin-binding protein 2 [Hyphomonadaceae bacterium]|nr:penicillin-binding protein 2 [Hyphomonadaceae bacterium]
MRAYAAPYPKDVWGPRRARIIAVGLALVFVVIVGRSAYVAFNGPDRSAVPVAAVEDVRRADIVDRRGELLATTVEGTSLAVDPSAIWDSRDVVAGIRTVFPDLREDALTAMMADKKRQFAWVKRGLDDEQIKALKELGVEGLMFVNEAQRRYPGGSLAGHFLGYTSIDGDGLEGVERVYDERLKQGVEPLQLTLDASVQFVVEEELTRASADFDMKGAAGIVLDAHTGAVRAIASWPQIDPRLRGEEGDDAKTNRALNARMELGSIYKPLTVAAALEAGVLQGTDTFDVSAPVKIGAVTVRDQHPLTRVSGKAATAADILAESSNIGTAMIAQRMGAERQKEFLGKVGLLAGHGGEGPQWASPLVPQKWDQTAMATVAYGHGISVSPLAFAMAYTPFANGGEYVSPSFIEPVDAGSVKRTRVMSARTADAVLGMMRTTVTQGSGKLAEANGYEVAGKTGTAEKPTPNGYDPDRNITSFAAVFPASRPQFVVLVVLDEAQPRTGEQRTAAYTAALIAGKVIARAAPLLDVQPVLEATATRGIAPLTRTSAEADAQ